MTTTYICSYAEKISGEDGERGHFLQCIDDATHEVYYSPVTEFHINLLLCDEHWGLFILLAMEYPSDFIGLDPSLDYRI